MDTNHVTKEEVLLLTRYILDHFRSIGGLKRSADNFAREAKIDEQQPLVGSLIEYYEPWWKENTGQNRIDFWTYFCHKKLKELREQHTFQGKALTITTPNQQNSCANPLRIENFNFPGSISGSSRNFLLMLKRFIFRYVNRDLRKRSADPFVKEEEIDAKEAYGGSGSKKRRTNAVVKCEDER